MEDFRDLLEEFVVGMLHDAGVGKRIGTMLADYDDSIDGQLAGAEGQCFRDGGVKLQGGMAVQPLLG